MATWKKVVISGSDISQLNNDAGYLTSVTATNAFSSASFNDVDLLADSAQGKLTFASSSGEGLTISASVGDDTLTFGLSSIPNTSLENDSITIGTTEIDLGASNTTLYGLTSVSSTQFTGSLSSTSVLLDGVTATTQTAGDNSTLVATTAYVDAVATTADLDLAGDGDTTSSVDLDSQILSFAGSDGLQLSASSQTISATIADGGIANTKLENDSITIGTTEIELGETVDQIEGIVFSGSASLPPLIDGSGIIDFHYNGSSSQIISVQNDGDTLTVGGGGVKVSDSGINPLQLSSSVAGDGLSGGDGTALSVDYGTAANTAVEGDTNITITPTTNAIDIVGNATQALGGGPTYLIDLSNTIDGDRTFSDNIIIGGDLVVQGTASFQETENLRIADRFALFASGSTTTGDGGIVVQQDTADTGELFGFDAGTSRWAVTSSFDASTATFTPDAFMANVVIGADSNPDNAPSRYTAQGNIFIGTDEDIWIYSGTSTP